MFSNHDLNNDLSRAEAEALCVLHAMEQGAQNAAALCQRVGFEPSLAPWVIHGLSALRQQGWLDEEDGVFYLTEPGQTYLNARLGALGLRRP